VSPPELSIGPWIMLGELMDTRLLDNGGCPDNSPELNIGQWRALGELTGVEYWTMEGVGSTHQS
jgi:hypothetical protein